MKHIAFIIAVLFCSSLLADEKFFLRKVTEDLNTKHFFYIKNPVVTDLVLRNHIKIYNPLTFYEGAIIKDELYMKSNNSLIYSANYQIGPFGMRKIKNESTNSKLPHLIFAGDSNVFGIGMNDHQLFSSLVQSTLIKENYVINLGMPGSFLNHFLYFQENIGLDKLLKRLEANSNGVLVYQVQHYLLERLVGSKEFVKWGEDSPWYEEVNGKLTFKGQFKDRFLTKVYKWISSIETLNKLIPNLPRIDEDEIYLAVKFLKEIEANYHKQTKPTNKFYVLLNPQGLYLNELEKWKQMVSIFKKSNLNLMIIEFKDKQNLKTIPYDGHFSENSHKYLADKIHAFLRN